LVVQRREYYWAHKEEKLKKGKVYYEAHHEERLAYAQHRRTFIRHPYLDADREYSRRKHLKKAYDITPEDYAILLSSQGNKCAICGKHSNKFLCVDHDHETKEIRGLLCSKCNTMLGLVYDDPDILYSAIKYLTRQV
jgi:hypothetical protein